MKVPKLSVIVPIYNLEQCISGTIESILSQTFQDFELILVDDGSTDASADICKRHAELDLRLRIVEQTNRGVSAARNLGLKYASGEYVGFVDGDDLLDENMYETLIQCIEMESADLGQGKICVKKDRYENEVHTQSKYSAFNCKDALQLFLQDRIITGSVCDKIFRRSLVEGNFFDEDICIGEDQIFVFTCLLKTSKLVYVPNTSYYYVTRMNSASKTIPDLKKYHSEIKAHQIIYDRIRKEKSLRAIETLAFRRYVHMVLHCMKKTLIFRQKKEFVKLRDAFKSILFTYIFSGTHNVWEKLYYSIYLLPFPFLLYFEHCWMALRRKLR